MGWTSLYRPSTTALKTTSVEQTSGLVVAAVHLKSHPRLRDGTIAVSSRNCGQAGTRITVFYSKVIDGDNWLSGFCRTAVVLQVWTAKFARWDPSSAVRFDHFMRVREKAISIVHNDELTILGGQKVTDHWYLMWFCCIKSTWAVQILTLGSASTYKRSYAASGEQTIQSAPLRQSVAGRAQTGVELLILSG